MDAWQILSTVGSAITFRRFARGVHSLTRSLAPWRIGSTGLQIWRVASISRSHVLSIHSNTLQLRRPSSDKFAASAATAGDGFNVAPNCAKWRVKKLSWDFMGGIVLRRESIGKSRIEMAESDLRWRRPGLVLFSRLRPAHGCRSQRTLDGFGIID